MLTFLLKLQILSAPLAPAADVCRLAGQTAAVSQRKSDIFLSSSLCLSDRLHSLGQMTNLM